VVDVKLLTVRQAAEVLAISTRKVYGLVAEGKLPHYRIDNTIRIAAADVENFIAECRVDRLPAVVAPAADILPRARKPAAGQSPVKTSHLKIGPRQLALLRRGGVGTSGPNGRSGG
jgi:excisionase family DNA binding protein